MANWTPQYSTLASLYLDKIVGTQDMIDTRQDYCKMHDLAHSIATLIPMYYTGSKAEGLNLPGSDDDYMTDINIVYDIKVIPSLDENTRTSPYSTFLMSTENIRPGFAFLQHVPQTPLDPFLNQASKYINGLRYLSSELFVQKSIVEMQNGYRATGFNDFITMRRQGPSREKSFNGFSDREPDDQVDCIHCTFWPSEAVEWRDRPRPFGWPTQDDLISITDFGFHLVAVGHPHSDTKEMEWRISFSVAERTLVWSFNHVQMQCYALMKIILKQFIKQRCNPQNQVLCSYFIKTFLFWKYETTDRNFWREDNLRECITFLLAEFSKCIREGMLRHYFIPRFNLLSVKLTPAAQRELLQLFDVIIESDIGILKDCGCLEELCEMYLQTIIRGNETIEYMIRQRSYLTDFINDMCMREHLDMINIDISQLFCWFPLSPNELFCQILSLFCKTPLHDLVLKCVLLNIHIKSATDSSSSRNKCAYRLKQTAQLDMCSFDISTCKLWCANCLYMTGNYRSALDIISQLLSSIPPYAMHRHASTEAELLYRDVYCGSDLTIIQKAKKAWMFEMFFWNGTAYPLPQVIKTELYFNKFHVTLSPFTCAYYLQFLCYNDLHQYENRDRALEQLVDFAKHAAVKSEMHRVSYSDLNIAGHCLLLAGKITEAREMFYLSYTLTEQFTPFHHAQNSARWYLLNCF